jgi:hypothetical protein
MQVYARQVRAGKSTLAARQQLLREHRAQVEAQVNELREALSLIDKKVQLYDQWIKRHAGVPQETL